MTAATTITPRDEMRAKLERAKTIAKAAENANRDFTASEHSEVKQLLADVERIKANIAAAKADSDLLATLKEIAVPADGNEPGTGIAAKGSGSLFADPSRCRRWDGRQARHRRCRIEGVEPVGVDHVRRAAARRGGDPREVHENLGSARHRRR